MTYSNERIENRTTSKVTNFLNIDKNQPNKTRLACDMLYVANALLTVGKNIVAAFQGTHVSPAKYSYM